MKSRIACILFAVFLGTSVFWAEVLNDYMTKADVIYGDFVSPPYFFLFFFGAVFIALIRLLFVVVILFASGRERTFSNLLCPAAILFCAYVGQLFPYQLNLAGDKFFFWLNEGYFKQDVISKKSEASPAGILYRASANFHKVFLYSPFKIPTGVLSVEVIRSLDPLEELHGCQMTATPLGERFYIIAAQC